MRLNNQIPGGNRGGYGNGHNYKNIHPVQQTHQIEQIINIAVNDFFTKYIQLQLYTDFNPISSIQPTF